VTEAGASENTNQAEPILNIPDIESAPRPDSDATREFQAIITDSYEDDARRQDHGRSQGLKNVGYWATVALIAGGVLLIIVMTGIWAWHMLLPPCRRWLSHDEVEHLQSLLFSGALSAALTVLGKKVL
jgi:hypothetical protein